MPVKQEVETSLHLFFILPKHCLCRNHRSSSVVKNTHIIFNTFIYITTKKKQELNQQLLQLNNDTSNQLDQTAQQPRTIRQPTQQIEH